MPVKDEVDVCGGDKVWRSSFSHDDEIVQPGYHRLFLDTYKIWVEQTVTDRVGLYRFTYTQDGLAKVLDKSGRSYSYFYFVDAHVTKVNDTEISGYFDTAGRVWGGVDVAKVYFVVQFDKPMDALNGWVGDRKETDIKSLIGSPELITVPKSSFKQSPSSWRRACFGSFKAGDELLLKTCYLLVE